MQVTISKGAVQEIGENSVIDLWLLVAIHSLPVHRKSVEKVFRQKVAQGGFSVALLESGLQGHAPALRAMFTSLVAITENLTRAGSEKQQKVGSSLYTLLFKHFGDVTIHQHEVLAAHQIQQKFFELGAPW